MLVHIVQTLISLTILFGLWRYRHDGRKMNWMLNIVFVWIIITLAPKLYGYGETVLSLAVSAAVALGIGGLIGQFLNHRRAP